jgi:hypothetical protein
LLGDAAELARMSRTSRERHGAMFTWKKVLGDYAVLLGQWHGLPCS